MTVPNLKASEIINNVKTKNDNNIELSDNEAIDLILAPDSKHDFEIKELLEITSRLLVNAKISDKDFHFALIECQKKMLQRFIKKSEREEMVNLLNFKAEDYGFEPNVTGFEEEINLSYLDGKRDGYDIGYAKGKLNAQFDIIKNLIKSGFDDKIILNSTEITDKTLQKLKNEIGD